MGTLIARGKYIQAVLLLLSIFPASVRADCMGMVLHAHRGSPAAPENALSAVRLALDGEWDGVEIDIQQLRDQQWVLHHDAQLGRTTSLQGRTSRELYSATWRELQMKDRQGRVTSESAPFLADVLALPERAEKVLNIEIKQIDSNCEPTNLAVKQLRRGLPNGGWFLTSVDRRQLMCARKADPRGYVGQIVLDPQALAFQSRSRSLSSRLKPPQLDYNWLSNLLQDVGAPVGAHVDINTLAANPSLLADAKALGMPIFTYHLGQDADQASALKAMARRTGLWPSGAIINGLPKEFCRQLMGY